MAIDGNLRAVRCLFEYMEGKPGQLVAAEIRQEGGETASADELAALLRKALAEVEAWRARHGEETGPGSCEQNG